MHYYSDCPLCNGTGNAVYESPILPLSLESGECPMCKMRFSLQALDKLTEQEQRANARDSDNE
jgi:hypothetical protein